ncbi:fimbrial protein [Trinickia mobilis]|uniref:fimbrial protein n=1 Tax=Trinickia mobilis TaxID=2816356 RepID=UPI001A8D764A|nr:fimbrial protein [Trinickia mobilis]
MKPSFKISMALLAVLSSLGTAAHAADGTINFTGKVLKTTCSVPNKNINVSMGTVSADDFNVSGAEGRDIPFKIELQSCDSGLAGVKVKMNGTADANQPDLLKIGQDAGDDAKGLGIRIVDDANTDVPINSESKEYAIGEGKASLEFKARYVSTSPNVEPGEANAQAEFQLTYR